MLKRSQFQTVLFALAIGIAGIAGCRGEQASQPIAPLPSPASSPIATATPPNPPTTDPAAMQAAYKLALEKASSAKNISQTALTEDDWTLVASRWKQAISLLKSLPASAPAQPLAKTKLKEFEREFATTQKKLSQAKRESDSTTASGLAGVNSSSLKVSSAISASGAKATSEKVFRALIKRREGGTPVIDVTFNGTQTFEMIVDTGASGTVITQAMAQALGARIIGKTKVNTASQAGVEVPLAYVDSIAVGNAVVKDVIVAIANASLNIGLLGHDFFSDYDLTVKREVVEFRRR
ncbi:TIGR02281 family clan AA aspartic protease [Leptolyngbyaceae cyanobacterium UHCC 1019]